MSEAIPPNTAAPPVQSTASQGSVARGVVVDGPDTVALTRGQILEGRVVSQSRGVLVLQTDRGPISVQTSATPPQGTLLSIQVQSDGARPSVLLLPQDGRPADATISRAAATSRAAAVTTALTQGSTIRAVVTGNSSNPTLHAATSQNTAAQSPAPAASHNTASNLLPGSAAAFRVLSVAPPGGAAFPNQSSAAVSDPATLAGTLAATVVNRGPGGLLVLQAGTAELTLTQTSPLPAGTRLLLQLLGIEAPRGDSIPRPGQIGGGWDALREALTTIQRGDTALARTTVENFVPTPGPRLAPGMLFFLSAVLSGDIRRFLGDGALRQLNRSNGTLVERLSNDFSQMQRLATDSAGQDWRLFLIPVLTEDGVDQLRFFVRGNEEDATSGDHDTGVRFLIEVMLSQLGAFQFDGIARDRTVDLVIRTHKELPQHMPSDIRRLYLDTLSALGFSGNLAFQITPTFDTMPVEAVIGPRKDLTV